jgi:hypothetical protein
MEGMLVKKSAQRRSVRLRLRLSLGIPDEICFSRNAKASIRSSNETKAAMTCEQAHAIVRLGFYIRREWESLVKEDMMTEKRRK